MKTLESLVAEKLLKIKAVKLQPANPFTWASGWKSPIYNDNRKTLSYPAVRSFIKLELARVISEKFENVDAIAGVATCLLYTSPSPRDRTRSRMPSSA